MIFKEAIENGKISENEITGLWFYEREDCKRIYKLLTKLLNENSTQSPPAVPLAPDTNFDVLSLLSRTHDHNMAAPSSGEHISNTNIRGKSNLFSLPAGFIDDWSLSRSKWC